MAGGALNAEYIEAEAREKRAPESVFITSLLLASVACLVDECYSTSELCVVGCDATLRLVRHLRGFRRTCVTYS